VLFLFQVALRDGMGHTASRLLGRFLTALWATSTGTTLKYLRAGSLLTQGAGWRSAFTPDSPRPIKL